MGEDDEEEDEVDSVPQKVLTDTLDNVKYL